VQFLLRAFANGRPFKDLDSESFPARWIPVRLKRYVYRQDVGGAKRLILDRYEFLVYQQVRNGLEAGSSTPCRRSISVKCSPLPRLAARCWPPSPTWSVVTRNSARTRLSCTPA